MAEFVRITEVGPRDGLQNEPGVIPTTEKAELVRLLCGTGVDEVEVTSFVSPKWVPQLGDAAELLRLLAFSSQSEGLGVGSPGVSDAAVGDSSGLNPRSIPDTLPSAGNRQATPQPSASEMVRSEPVLSALVPNLIGLEGALDANRQAHRRQIAKVSVFTAASETFCRRNVNASIDETIQRFTSVIQQAKQSGLRVRGYVSCAIACPFEGPIAPQAVVDVSLKLSDIGVDEIDLGDTIGAADVASTVHLLEVMREQFEGLFFPGGRSLTLHLHDTFGRAADCVIAALDLGVRSFDGSVAGLGGCPYASTPGKRAPGNISTQTLVRTIHEAGYTTGVDLAKLEEAGRFAMKIVGEARTRAVQVSKP